MDKGTLYQLRNVINRRNVSASAENDFNACDDFFQTVVETHILAAAMQHFNMSSVSDIPLHSSLTEDLWLKSAEERKDILQSVCMEVVSSFGTTFLDTANVYKHQNDKVHCYATKLLSYGLLYLEFSDAIREGDGLRTLRCWRYFLILFKIHKRYNYSIEALHLLSQYHFFLTQRQREQLIWSRFINTHGVPGRNIPSDLYNEHLNKVCKTAVANLGANVAPTSLKRVGKMVGILSDVQLNFDEQLHIQSNSGHHEICSAERDIHLMLGQLLDANVFHCSYNDSRQHNSFPNMQSKSLSSIKIKEFYKWMTEHIESFRNKMY
jgi:L1 cell adhesion molecule like protein